MALTADSKLGPYEIQSPLGAGGMGEVYRASDKRLGRDVALKILPESFARDADCLRRFEQEARAVAALNHPNVLAIHDIGQHEGSPFLVSELLEGESLRAAVDRGALPQRKTIEYGVQIAHGLAAAHEKGIVHRDLKPENIFVTKDGRIKILDFGLAKLAQKAGVDRNEVTLTSAQHTVPGVVMGTASYMAPEQVRGEGSDPRTHIFAFGTVLYEMLSGIRAFRRDTAAETMTAVLRDDPPELSNPSRLISPTLERIVRRCLEKSPDQRFQSARDLSFALSTLSGTESSPIARTAAVPRRTPLLPWLAAALALVVVSAATWFVARRPHPTTLLQFVIYNTGVGAAQSALTWMDRSGKELGRVGDPAVMANPTLSPDGSRVAVDISDQKANNVDIWIETTTRPANSRFTFDPSEEVVGVWSRDGSMLAYRMAGADGTNLYLKPATGLEREKKDSPSQSRRWTTIFPIPGLWITGRFSALVKPRQAIIWNYCPLPAESQPGF